ncbi:hypothetical protein BUALT_Bualt03G0195500 [Buddleja alternifolia]|uniref:Late embryogenesis abundant protein LEA-2 subgroup domain-containing protein n=1 Tax=Buddleja alternifolia TaxID=168488 RepID=A0AAV6XV38_9LAMI|nr:hypothetical protein BUALT_Bualt03G0195500 [Buddleja alternifolia]
MTTAIPTQYVMLQGGGVQPTTAPYRRSIPQYNSNYQKRSSTSGKCCFRWVCCFCCCLFIIILTLAIVAFYFYTMYHPKMPTYNIEDLQVKAFDFQPDFSLDTEFVVSVKADNPNSKIGFIYGKDSSIVVTYSDNNICEGKLPNFHQGHKNTTIMNIDLKGKSAFGSGLQEALAESRKNQRIPLVVSVKVPINVVIAGIPLRQFKVFVNCSLVVDNLAPNKKIGIISRNTTFDFKL